MSDAVLRAKMTVNSVKLNTDGQGNIIGEELELSAVYGPEGTPNAQWSKWTPCARLTMSINNPGAFGKVRAGQFLFVDLVPTDKDGI